MAVKNHRPESLISEAYGSGQDSLRQMIASDIAVLLPDDFLVKVDRASMAAGLEVRPPLVDHEFLELTARIPSRWKIRGGETKWIFKKLCERKLPREIVWRKKQGFEIPIDQWLRGPLRDAMQELVLSPQSRIAQYIRPEVAQQLYRAHQNRTGRHGNVLWSLLVLGAWLQRYGANAPQRSPDARYQMSL